MKTLIQILAAIIIIQPAYSKADSPQEDYKEASRYNFGSLIKDKLCLSIGDSAEKHDDLGAKKQPMYGRDRLFDKAIEALSGFPLELVDRKNWKIETGMAIVSKFDPTNSIEYKISISIISENDISVVVTSDQESKEKLLAHSSILKEKIIALAK